MTIDQFAALVEDVRQFLEDLAHTNPAVIAACKSGEDFEVCVRDAIESVLVRKGILAEIQYEQGSHTFPDIVLIFEDRKKYGIEVKSSSGTGRSWKINGNSVLGSTRKDVIATYILFGKTAMGYQAFRCKRYEDCIVDVAVTHSPRYRIDMDLAPGTTFFDRAGLSYRQISSSEKPIELITDYFRSQGQHAWWLAESTPAAIRMFSALTDEKKKTLLGYCFAHFPEVFSSDTTKFSRCAMWLVSEHSVVSSSLRDNFSAGGRFVYLEFGRIPRIFDTLNKCKAYVIRSLNESTMENLCEDWGIDYLPEFEGNDKLSAWIGIANAYCYRDGDMGYNAGMVLESIMR